jgi:hypothetical protein
MWLISDEIGYLSKRRALTKKILQMLKNTRERRMP